MKFEHKVLEKLGIEIPPQGQIIGDDTDKILVVTVGTENQPATGNELNRWSKILSDNLKFNDNPVTYRIFVVPYGVKFEFVSTKLARQVKKK